MKRVPENNLFLTNFDFGSNIVCQIIFNFLWKILEDFFVLIFFWRLLEQNENSTISIIIFNSETFEFDTIALAKSLIFIRYYIL